MSKTGLAVMRLQPLHLGHCQAINRMIQDCETAIICLGSAQKSREEHDPWTVEERMQMLKNVYSDRIKIVPLNDLGASGPEEWTDYIFEKFNKLGMKEPTDYFTGSHQDSLWYRHIFDEIVENSTYRADLSYYKTLHLLDRNANQVPSATEIRGFLQLRTDGWKQWVPRINHKIVESNYPEEFKIPEVEEIPF